MNDEDFSLEDVCWTSTEVLETPEGSIRFDYEEHLCQGEWDSRVVIDDLGVTIPITYLLERGYFLDEIGKTPREPAFYLINSKKGVCCHFYSQGRIEFGPLGEF